MIARDLCSSECCNLLVLVDVIDNLYKYVPQKKEKFEWCVRKNESDEGK